MNTDDLKILARRADGVHGREADRIAEVHGRIRTARRRRVIGAAAAAAAVVLTVAVGSTMLNPTGQRTDEPVDVPTPTRTEKPEKTIHPAKGTKRLSPRQTVLSYNAHLVTAAYAPDDPDVRVSVWETECLVCPKGNPRRFSYQTTFRALAVTKDGYRTTVYLRPSIPNLDSIHSVSRTTFTLNDTSNGVLKLLETDGTYRRVRMVDETRTPDDPRLTIPCAGFEGGYGAGWCVLEVATATAARLPSTWTSNGGSYGNPALGQRPWGLESFPIVSSDPATSAWWDDAGVRRYADALLTEKHHFLPVPSLSKGDDTPTYLGWLRWSQRLDVFVAEDRAGGLTKAGTRPFLPLTRQEMSEPGHPKELGIYPEYVRTPDGALLAWSYGESTNPAGLTIWRASSVDAGEFETVYEGPLMGASGFALTPDLTTHDGVLYLDTLMSEDDGRTWTEPITTWR